MRGKVELFSTAPFPVSQILCTILIDRAYTSNENSGRKSVIGASFSNGRFGEAFCHAWVQPQLDFVFLSQITLVKCTYVESHFVSVRFDFTNFW